jgi:hypothetical protein
MKHEWNVETSEDFQASVDYMRQMTHIDGHYVRIKSLDDIARMEQRCWDMRVKARAYWNEVVRPLAGVIRGKGGKAHCKPTHKFEPYKNYTWWLWEIDDMGFSWDWCEEPDEPINIEEGTAMYQLDRRSDQLFGRANLFKRALERAISGYLYDNEEAQKAEHGQTLRLELNGRNYWYSAEKKYPDSKVYFEKLQMPMDNTIEIAERCE